MSTKTLNKSKNPERTYKLKRMGSRTNVKSSKNLIVKSKRNTSKKVRSSKRLPQFIANAYNRADDISDKAFETLIENPVRQGLNIISPGINSDERRRDEYYSKMNQTIAKALPLSPWGKREFGSDGFEKYDQGRKEYQKKTSTCKSFVDIPKNIADNIIYHINKS